MHKDPTEIHTRLAPEYILVSTAAFIVAISWSNFFNTLFESIARRYDSKDDGPVELALRLGFAALLTVTLIILGHTYLKLKLKKQKKEKNKLAPS
jgi:uncharacterized membrane protein